MNFHDTKMGHAFFEHQLPQLIQALTAALDKPVQAVAFPMEADPEFLSKLYLGEYEPAPFRQTPEGAEFTRAVNAAHEELKAVLPESCHEKLMKYQDTLTMRERRRFADGLRVRLPYRHTNDCGRSVPVQSRTDGT